MDMSLIVSSNDEFYVTNNTYGSIFTPVDDGRYVVSVQEYCEEISSSDYDDDGHSHSFYSEVYRYIVDVNAGEISVTYEGMLSYKESEADSYDVLDSAFFTFVNGYMPNPYITTVYGDYRKESYFCVTLGEWKNVNPVVVSDTNIAAISEELCIPSGTQEDYVKRVFKIKALNDGEVTVDVDGDNQYALKVKDGIFHNTDIKIVYGDADGDGDVDIDDVVAVTCYVADSVGNTLSDYALSSCDVYDVGSGVNSMDALSMQKYLVKVIDSLPETTV
jgi:hypothetical protein